MRIAALLIGIIASFTALVGVVVTLTMTTLEQTRFGFGLAVMTLLAAGLAMAMPRVAGLLFVFCGLGLLWALNWVSLLVVPVYAVAAILALLSPNPDARASAHTGTSQPR
ncbi:MAG: hypothetical protein VW405_10060 [Rhodospirillaceae bacterium]